MDKFVIEKIEPKTNTKDALDLVQRLYDFGFYPGLEVQIVATVSFNAVTVVQFGNTRMALNSEELKCLRGH